jgi:hypothetical protein
MIKQVNMEKFHVEKQQESWLCWAATAKAIISYKGKGSPDQKGLGKLYPNKVKGNSPAKVLREHYGLTEENLIDWPEKAKDATEASQRKQDFRDNLKYSFDPAVGPLLCGLTEANDSKWALAGNPDYVFRHAVLLFKWNDTDDQVYLADPALPETRSRYFAVKIADIVDGLNDIRTRLYFMSRFT